MYEFLLFRILITQSGALVKRLWYTWIIPHYRSVAKIRKNFNAIMCKKNIKNNFISLTKNRVALCFFFICARNNIFSLACKVIMFWLARYCKCYDYSSKSTIVILFFFIRFFARKKQNVYILDYIITLENHRDLGVFYL